MRVQVRMRRGCSYSQAERHQGETVPQRHTLAMARVCDGEHAVPRCAGRDAVSVVLQLGG